MMRAFGASPQNFSMILGIYGRITSVSPNDILVLMKTSLQTASVGIFTLVLLSSGSRCLAQELQKPQALAGWEISMEEELRLVELPLKAAPLLPAWPVHGDRKPEGHSSLSSHDSEVALTERMETILERAIHIVNGYLPADVAGNFQLWIFKDIPYAAKTLNPQLILSAEVLSPENGERLPFVIAHEMHHLALMRTGFLKPHASVQTRILSGLLTEGTATWLSFSSGLFPELDRIIQDPQQLRTSFGQIRNALSRSADAQSPGEDLFQQNKWGYYVGCWMIQQIEERLGREAWLILLNQSPEEAARELVTLYLRTNPPAEYRF